MNASETRQSPTDWQLPWEGGYRCNQVPLPAQMAAAGGRLAQLVVIDALVAALSLRDPERSRRAERAGIDLPDIS